MTAHCFGFLSDSLQNNVTIALNKIGGFQEVISRGCDFNKDLIKFEIKFRNQVNEMEKTPIVTYVLEIGFKNGKAIFSFFSFCSFSNKSISFFLSSIWTIISK